MKSSAFYTLLVLSLQVNTETHFPVDAAATASALVLRTLLCKVSSIAEWQTDRDTAMIAVAAAS